MEFNLIKFGDRTAVVADGGTIAWICGAILLPVIQLRYWPDGITYESIMNKYNKEQSK